MYFYGKLKIASGSVHAVLSEVYSNFSISFGTQEDGEFTAPSVELNVLNLNLNGIESTI